MEDKNGNLWVTDGLYLYRYNHSADQFERYSNLEQGKNILILLQDEYNDGQLWFLSKTSLCRIDPYTLNLHVQKTGLPPKIFKCLRDKYGMFWMSDGLSLYKYTLTPDLLSDISISEFYNDDTPLFHGCYMMEMIYDIWAFMKYPENLSLPYKNINVPDEMTLWPEMTGDSLVWAFQKTYPGIKLLSRQNLDCRAHFISSRWNDQSLVNNKVTCLTADWEGILWIGHPSGISMVHPDRQGIIRHEISVANTLISGSRQFINNSHSNLLEDNILFVDEPEISYWYNGEMRTLLLKNYKSGKLTEKLPLSACYDRHGALWITSTFGIHRINKLRNTIDYSYILNPTGGALISNLQCDSANNLHFIWNGKLIFWNVDKLGKHRLLDTKTGMDEYLMDKIMGKDGKIWACDKKSMYVYSVNSGLGKIMRRYNISEYTKPYSPIGSNIIDMHLDHSGNLWLTLPYGILKMDTLTGKCISRSLINVFVPHKKPESLNNSVFDEKGNIWSASSLCLYCYQPAQDRLMLFSDNDGLSLSAGSMLYSIGKYLYCSYPDNTFDQIDPDNVLRPKPSPKVYIDGFSIGNKAINMNWDSVAFTPFTLNYYDNVITFKYTSIDFEAQHTIKFRYRLDGFDRDWQDAGKRTEATYMNLKSGFYTFRVQAINKNGSISASDATMQIYTKPAYWETWWFRSLIAIAIAFILNVIYNYRKMQRLKQESIRLRIARDLHDEVGSTLSSISILSELALRNMQADIDRVRFSAIGDRAKQVMETMSDIIWSVNPGNDSMEKVIYRMREFAVEILETKGMSLHFEVSEQTLIQSISIEVRKDFYLIFKEAINNVAKYSDAKDVWVLLHIKNNYINLEIRDNGNGFDLSKDTQGNGLRNMQHRASILKGELNIQSQIGVGTTIVLVIQK